MSHLHLVGPHETPLTSVNYLSQNEPLKEEWSPQLLSRGALFLTDRYWTIRGETPLLTATAIGHVIAGVVHCSRSFKGVGTITNIGEEKTFEGYPVTHMTLFTLGNRLEFDNERTTDNIIEQANLDLSALARQFILPMSKSGIIQQ